MLQQGIHLLKYRDRTELAPLLTRYLIATFQREIWPVPQSAVDLVVPVPLHAQRLADRGYNQAELLADAFCRSVNLPLDAAAVIRVRQTDSQVGKNAEERRTNVADAFVARPVQGNVCLVIDDVCTTGATLNATADALKAAGARLVLGLTLAVPTLHETPPENAN